MEKPTDEIVGLDNEDPLAPARGVVSGLIICVPMWTLVFGALRVASVL